MAADRLNRTARTVADSRHCPSGQHRTPPYIGVSRCPGLAERPSKGRADQRSAHDKELSHCGLSHKASNESPTMRQARCLGVTRTNGCQCSMCCGLPSVRRVCNRGSLPEFSASTGGGDSRRVDEFLVNY